MLLVVDINVFGKDVLFLSSDYTARWEDFTVAMDSPPVKKVLLWFLLQ